MSQADQSNLVYDVFWAVYIRVFVPVSERLPAPFRQGLMRKEFESFAGRVRQVSRSIDDQAKEEIDG